MVAWLLVGFVLFVSAGNALANPRISNEGRAAVEKTGAITTVQLSEAEQAWEAIRNTPSAAVLNTFIARYKDTRFADLARKRLEDIKPKQATPVSSLKASATTEDMIAELPIDMDVLRLVETHEFFRTQVPVAVGDYTLTRSRTEMSGGYQIISTTDEAASIRVVRGSIIRVELIQDDTTAVPKAKVTTKYKRQGFEIDAANGLVELASKTSGVGKPGSEQVTTLVRIDNIRGKLFALQKGNKFGLDAVYRQVDATAPEEFTQKRDCQVVDDQDATQIHPDLTGRAYVMTCEFRVAYKRSKRYTGNLGIHSSHYQTIFIPALGIWLDTTGTYKLKTFHLAH
jgi:hypothetical protein